MGGSGDEIRPASKREGYDMAAGTWTGPCHRLRERDREDHARRRVIHMRPERWNTFDFRVMLD